nr:hypothetical protein [Kutzneria chonburiensis]
MPAPDGATTVTGPVSRLAVTRSSSCARARSRPWNHCASPVVNAASPRYGQLSSFAADWTGIGGGAGTNASSSPPASSAWSHSRASASVAGFSAFSILLR